MSRGKNSSFDSTVVLYRFLSEQEVEPQAAFKATNSLQKYGVNAYEAWRGMELGRKICNLDNAIWILQGRHRDMVHFADYIYEQPFKPSWPSAWLPGRKEGKWEYIRGDGRHLDKDKFEEFKSRYYELEGWDTKTGWPKKETLESLALDSVAGAHAERAKLGSG